MNDQATINGFRGPKGYTFKRGDGEVFFLRSEEDVSAVLYHGSGDSRLPAFGLIHFDVSIADKVSAAERWVAFYSDYPAP